MNSMRLALSLVLGVLACAARGGVEDLVIAEAGKSTACIVVSAKAGE